MDGAPNRLFHLQYDVPDLPRAERVLAEAGIPPHQRVGRVDGEQVVLGPGEEPPDGFEFRLQTMQRGALYVTLMPADQPRFNHVGIATSAFDAIVERAREAGWGIEDPEGPRPFLSPPREFRIELHPEGDGVVSSMGDPAEARLDAVVLASPDPDGLRSELGAVLGEVPGLRVEEGGGDGVSAPRFRIAGGAFPEPFVVRDDELL